MTNKTTKRAMLSSVVALFLCCAMLMGTTYAWFTDSVTSANNVIKSGNLDVELEYWNDGKWDDVAGKSDILTNKLWEPGVAEVAYLRVANAGSLALKYQLGVNIVDEAAGVNAAGAQFKLSDYIQFGVVEHVNGETGAYATREAAVAAIGEGQKISAGYTKASSMESGDELYLALVVWMPESVGNEANHNGKIIPKIDLGLNIFATQMAAEEDSFGPDYDENAGLPWDGETVTENLTADADGVYHITSAADLVAMMNDSKYPNCNKYQNVVLECDINLGGKEISGFGDGSGFFDGIFDGQGYTISNFTIDASNRTYYAGLFNQVSQYSGENTVIKNLTVANATVVGSGQVGVIVGGMNGNTVVDNCKVINSTAIGVKKVGSVVGYTAGGTVTNNSAENCTVYYSEKEGEVILGYENTGSTVSGNTYSNVTVKQATAIFDEADLVKLGGTKINGTYVLMANLDMFGYDMKSMEISGGANVTFIGNGHTISNLTLGAAKIHGMTGAGNEVAGLFDMSAPGTTVSLTVKDVAFENATVACNGGYAAVVVGYNSNAGSTITLNNVDVAGATVTADSVAALVGYTTGVVNLTDCDVSDLALTCMENRDEKVGALVGTANTATCVVTAVNCTNDTEYRDFGRVINGAKWNGGIPVSTTAQLIDAIKKAPVGSTTTIYLADMAYDGDIAITVAALGKSGGDVVIKAMDGAKPVITGMVTLGYRNQGVGAEMYDANVTFEGITFDQAAASTHSIMVMDVKSLTLKNCTIKNDGEYGIDSARGNGTGASKIVGCTFENAGMQLLGNFATGLVIDGCIFNNSRINVQAGNGVTVQKCEFNATLTNANVDDSFYAIRSNSTPITVKDCVINVDSELEEVVTAPQAKWYLLANRGTTNWTVENVVVNLTAAAAAQTQLQIKACTSTGAINGNVTVNN